MSAAVAQRTSPHMPRSSTSRNHSPMEKKVNVKKEDTSKESSSSANQQKTDTKSPPRPAPPTVAVKEDRKDNQPAVSNAEAAQPLAPPPKPSQNNDNSNNDYFSTQHGNTHYSLEPNLFEQSFGTGGSNPPDTPGKSLLPPVASLTSPQLLTGGGSIGSGYWQGGSLRSGPLSPAMLSGPAGPGDYFDNSLRGSFPTPNESSLRTGLTPGGGGSMFPAQSPGTQALFNSLNSGGATPNTLEFQRTAMNAAVASKTGVNVPKSQPSQAPTSQAQSTTMAPTSQASTNNSQFPAHHDNEAANGLYLLAQAGNESQSNNQFAVPPQPAHVNDKRQNNGSVGGNSAQGDGSENHGSDGDSKQNTRKSKRGSTGKSGNKRKNEETPTKPATKKSKPMSVKSDNMSMDDDSDQEEIKMQDHDENGRKMTDEEKRKNFLERNRVAALKCRQRKKQWLANLQAKVEIFSSENDALNSQVSSLREEILNLKTILIAHKDCPISQNQPQPVGHYLPPQGGDYQHQQYAGMQQGQPVMAGPRRFS